MSTEAPSLAAALAAVQRKLPDVRKAETAHVRSDKGNYSYRYATLPDITKAVLPLLGENGLAWVTRPTLVDDRFVLVYELLHTSGEKVSGEYPLPTGGSPQALGSAITYARRYLAKRITEVVEKRLLTPNDAVSLRQKLVAKREVIAGMSEQEAG